MDNELFKMIDMLCKSTNNTNPFHVMARAFSNQQHGLFNTIRSLLKDSSLDMWRKIHAKSDVHCGIMKKCDDLVSTSLSLNSAIKDLSENDARNVVLQFSL
eukprot:UN00052